MSKYKAGLHKDVSLIFNGVSIPKNDSAQQPSSTPAAGHQDHNASKSPAPVTPAQKPTIFGTPGQKQPVSVPPVQKPPVSETPAQKPATSATPVQKQPASVPPVQKPPVSETPAQKPATSATPIQKQPASVPPTQKPPISNTPVQKPAAPVPPTQKPAVPVTPAQKPPVSSTPAQKPLASVPPVQKPPVSETPIQKQPASVPLAQKMPSSETPAQRPSAPEPSVAKSPASEPPAQKPLAPSNITSTKPKSQQQSKDAKQLKAKTAAKSAGKSQWQKKLEMVKSKLLAPKEGVSPAKQKVMVVLIPVLFIALIFVFIRVFSQPKKVAGPKISATAKTAEVADDKKIEWKIPEPYPTTLRDPMQFGPAVAVQVDQTAEMVDVSGIVIKGIVYSEINPCVIIGDKIMHQGDKVSGVTIVKIRENNVEFEANGKKWTQKVQR
ncbi:MAG: hypothetical protein JW947_03825 [Sedimentisphaerales bacterium]|nr:hypothetical protein [Sedimentisphaerales bacterium]